MKSKTKKLLSLVIMMCVILVSIAPVQTQAAVKLNVSNATISTGRNLTVKIIGTNTAKWTVSNSHIKIAYQTGTYARIKGVSVGTSYLKANVNGKTYKCKITVDSWPKPDGSRANPYDAFNPYTSDIYYFGQRLGKFKIQLLDYRDGEDAQSYMDALNRKDEDFNCKIKKNQEFVCMKFRIKYVSGNDEVFLGNLINGFYNSDANKSVTRSVVIDELPGNTENMEQLSILPGANVTCMSISVIKKGNAPVTYDLETKNNNYPLFIIP